MKIRCPACDFENEESAIFCSNCGKSFFEEGITEQRKKEIREEERIRVNERENIDAEWNLKGCGCFIVSIIIIIVIIYLNSYIGW